MANLVWHLFAAAIALGLIAVLQGALVAGG